MRQRRATQAIARREGSLTTAALAPAQGNHLDPAGHNPLSESPDAERAMQPVAPPVAMPSSGPPAERQGVAVTAPVSAARCTVRALALALAFVFGRASLLASSVKKRNWHLWRLADGSAAMAHNRSWFALASTCSEAEIQPVVDHCLRALRPVGFVVSHLFALRGWVAPDPYRLERRGNLSALAPAQGPLAPAQGRLVGPCTSAGRAWRTTPCGGGSFSCIPSSSKRTA